MGPSGYRLSRYPQDHRLGEGSFGAEPARYPARLTSDLSAIHPQILHIFVFKTWTVISD